MKNIANESELDVGVKKNIQFYIFIAVTSLLACSLYYHVFVTKALIEIELEVTKKSEFKLYWAEQDQPFSETRMGVVNTIPGKNNYSFFLTNISSLARLRVDTHNYPGEAVLKSLRIKQNGFEEILLSGKELTILKPIHQVADYEVNDNGLLVISSGIDANFLLLISPVHLGVDKPSVISRLLVICGLIVLLGVSCRHHAEDFKFVPVLLFGVWLLVLVMAVISKQNAHPDEYVHVAAANYYTEKWSPPDLADPEIEHTFSVYGVSRLSSGEIFYLLAGKFKKLLEPMALTDLMVLRLFNVLLLGIIVCYAFSNASARLVALPILLSSQIWYVFSYCNSDAFALFVAFLAMCQIAQHESLTARFLKGGGLRSDLIGVFGLGFFVALMLLLKKNYYPVVALFYFCLLLKIFYSEEYFWDRKATCIRLFVASLVGGLLFVGWHSMDYRVNGMDRDAKVVALKEVKAEPAYKPSTPLEQTNPFLYKRAKGVTWKEMINKDRWLNRCVDNSFGNLGYGTLTASPIYYQLMCWVSTGLVVFLMGSVVLRGGVQGAFLGLMVLLLSAVLVFASFYHSWVHDFQPQGRYLFATVPMLGLLCALFSHKLYRPCLVLGVTAMFTLSLYFYIFQGMLRIPKFPV